MNCVFFLALFRPIRSTEESLMGHCSIEEIGQLPDDVRSSLVADLYFKMDAPCFADKLNGVRLWDYLLTNNKIDPMIFGIDAHCRDVADVADVQEVATEGEFSLTPRASQRLAIDEDIVERVASSGATYPVKELVLDRLSGYGLFTRQERQYPRSVLARFFSNRVTPEAFHSMLLGFRCTLDPDEFAKQVFSVIYHRGASDCPASCANAMETGSLLGLISELASRPEVTLLVRAIIKNIEVFHEDLETHIRDDPVLLLTQVFLEHLARSSHQAREDAPTFRDIPKNDFNLGPEAIGSETIQHSLGKIPYLAAALEDFPKSNEPTMYDLLNGYEGCDLARALKWRDQNDILPKFRSENLARNYGREEKLSYEHYLRESRASMAVRALERESVKPHRANKVKPRRAAGSCAAEVNWTAHEKVKVNEGNKVEAELMGNETSKVNVEVIEIKADNGARRFNNKVEVYEEVRAANVDQVKVHEAIDAVKANEEVERFKVEEDPDRRQSMSIDRPSMNKVNEIKLNNDAIKVDVMISEVDQVRKVKMREAVDEVKTKKGIEVVSDEVKASHEVKVIKETHRFKISGDFEEVMAKKGMKVKNKVRVQIGGDIKVEMKVEAAAYARGLALESGDEEARCTCIAFIALLGLNSECLRLGATAWAYVNKSLGISIRDSLRSLGPTSSQRDVTATLRLLERSFEANLARDRPKDSSKVDLKSAITATDRPEIVDTLEANDEVDLKEIPGEDKRKVDLDGTTEDGSNCGCRPFNLNAVLKDTQSFVDASRTWETIVGFARIHETSAPRSYFRLLALHDRRLEFVLAGQMFSYPLEAMLESAREFANPHVREHLCLALRNTRLLVTRSDHETRKSREFPDATESEELEDLWTIVLRCHASRDPPGSFLKTSRTSRSPVLTVLAAFYEPSATSGFCYSWLVVSVGAEKLLREYEIPLREELWSAQSVRHLLKSCLDLGYAGTLARAFLIFMPEHPLGLLFRAYCGFLDDADHQKAALTALRGFVEACANLGCNPGIDWDNTTNEDYLWNLRWIVLVAVQCSMSLIARCSSSLHLGLVFLELHTRALFNEKLYVATPNFATLRRVVAILAHTPVQFNFDAIQFDGRGSNVDREIQRCVDQLLDLEDFENALALSKVAGLRCSNIILAQYRSEFKRSTSMLSVGKLEPLFWKRCAADLRKYEVSFDETAAFFIEYAGKVLSHRERYEILKLALESLEPIATDKKTLDTVEMAMWKSCVAADPDSIEIETAPRIFDKLTAELLSGIVDLRVSCRLNDATEENAVGVLISRFVADGQLATALHISAIFTYKHRDLQILLLCMSLAEGEISPYQLTSQQRSLLAETGRVKLQKYSNLRDRGEQRPSPGSTVSKVSPSVKEDSSHFLIQQIHVDTLLMIDRLTKSLENGSATGTRILLCAKLAIYLRRSYQSLLNLADPMSLLYEVVGSNCDRKLEMVNDIVATYRIKNESVAKFLAEEIIANTPRLVEENLEDSLVMWGNPLGSNIQAIIDLCNDPALLGWELLNAANLSLGNSHVLTLKVAIELLIRSHDCFTASCSMEGIASILRKAQHLAYTLQHRKRWSLLWSACLPLNQNIGRSRVRNPVREIRA